MDISNFFRFAYWLDPALSAQPPSSRLWLVIVAGVIWAIGWALWRLRRGNRPFAGLISGAQIAAGLLVSGVAIGRMLAVPILGSRIGWLLALALATLPFGWHWLRLAQTEQWLQQAARMLAFVPRQSSAELDPSVNVPRPAPPWLLLLPWFGMHLLGMAVTTSIHRWPIWMGWVLMGFMVLPLLVGGLGRGLGRMRCALAGVGRGLGRIACAPTAALCLTPLLSVYATVVLRVFIGFANYVLHGEYRVPEPFSTLFNPTLALLVAVGYGFVLSCRAALGSDKRLLQFGAIVLVGLSLGWSTWTGLSLRTHGVSGSDPYAYTQMGVDLVTRSTLFHPFPLVRLTYALEIPSEPVVHIGYKLPTDITRTAPTVWPPGYAVFTGLAYALGGETGVFVLAPLINLLSLLVVAQLARHVCLTPHALGAPHATPYAIIALTVFITATSYQQIEWQLIPMADIAAQLFSLLALTLSLGRPHAPRPWPRAALAGLCIGIAFGIRYTQVLIAPAIALALWLQTDSDQTLTMRSRLAPIFMAGVVAALAALPTLAYHAAAFGGPFHTGSDELQHFSLALLPQTAQRLFAEMSWYREFGLLWPFMLIGVLALWRHQRRLLLLVLAYALPVLGFHLLYSYLRQRDLLSIFPIFNLFAAVGVVAIWQFIDARRHKSHRPVLATVAAVAFTLLTCFLMLQRSIETLMLPINRGFGAFGYLVREQRQSFDQLAQLTPQNAVIACSLNSGAVDLHAHRLSFRPAGWQPVQLIKFVQTLQAEATPVFVLDDGKELAESISSLRRQFTLVEAGQIDVPYYFPNSGGSENRRVTLYKVLPTN